MRRDSVKFLFLVAGLVLALGFLSTLSADVAASADILSGDGCFFFDANGTLVFDPNGDLQLVFTNNNNGNGHLICHGNLPSGSVLPSEAMHFDAASTGGFTCLGSVKWTMTVTPTGEGSFICHIPD